MAEMMLLEMTDTAAPANFYEFTLTIRIILRIVKLHAINRTQRN